MATAPKLSNLTHEQAEKMACEVVRLEAVIKKMKDDIKSFVEENGELTAGGKIWSISETLSLKLTAEQTANVAKLLSVQGINPFEVLNITANDLKKLGWNEEQLKTVGTVSYSKRFGSKNEK